MITCIRTSDEQFFIMERRSFGLVKIYFVIFVVYIGFFLCVKFGIPYIYEKYGMPVDAVVYGISKDTKGSFLARYEFIVDQKKYRGSTYSNVHEGDTICVWYCPYFPCLNIYVPNE